MSTNFFQSTKSPHFPLRRKVCQLSKRKRVLCWSISESNESIKSTRRPHLPPSSLILWTFGQHQSPWTHRTLVPNTADRSSGVGQMSPKWMAMGGGGCYLALYIDSLLYGISKYPVSGEGGGVPGWSGPLSGCVLPALPPQPALANHCHDPHWQGHRTGCWQVRI